MNVKSQISVISTYVRFNLMLKGIDYKIKVDSFERTFKIISKVLYSHFTLNS